LGVSIAVKFHIGESVDWKGKYSGKEKKINPILRSKFSQLQITGKKAEQFFISNFQTVLEFQSGVLEDARFLGDGYDFQIQVATKFYLAEVKGIRTNYGSIRMTEKEYIRAQEYQTDYSLVIAKNLDDVPQLMAIFDPVNSLQLTKKITNREQITFHSDTLNW
jgi:hypothetical protein